MFDALESHDAEQAAQREADYLISTGKVEEGVMDMAESDQYFDSLFPDEAEQ